MMPKKKWSTIAFKAVTGDDTDSSKEDGLSNLENAEPELCIKLLGVPSIQNYTGLKKRISESDEEWMQQFLEQDGLGVLFAAAERICDRKMTFADAYLQLEVVACIRSVMSSKIGLDFVASNEESTRKLARVLDTNNVLVKKQVFELLSGLCVYSHKGYMLAIDALEDYKRAKNLRYRFSLIIKELKNAEIIPYKTMLLAFVNAILISTEEFEIRVRLRNEFIGLQLLDILEELRRDEERTEDQDLSIQLDCFFTQKLADDDELDELFPEGGVDLNSPVDVFHAVFKKIEDSPQAASLLSILHAFLQLESSDPLYDKTWELLEKVVIQAIALDKGQDIATLLNEGLKTLINLKKVKEAGGESLQNKEATPNVLLSKAVSTQTDFPDSTVEAVAATEVPCVNTAPPPPPPPPPPPFPGAIALPSLGISGTPSPPQGPPPPPPPPPPLGFAPAPPPPPPPLPPILGGAPPPPPPPPGGGPPPPPPPPPPAPLGGGPPPPPPPPGGGPPPPPPPPGGGPPPPPPPGGFVIAQQTQALTMSAPVKPKKKLRTLNWSKIPANRVMSPSPVDGDEVKNIWRNISESPMDVTPEFEVLEDLFSQKTKSPKKAAVKEKPKKETQEVSLLDSKRSLNVNIFLKQFRKRNEEIIDLIEKGDAAQLGGIEVLKGMEKLLPTREEIDTIHSYKGDEALLGVAERFFLLLTRLSNYKLRINGMVVKEDYAANMDYLKPAVSTLQECCNGILESKLLQEFLALVLVTGNYMNSGGFAGNAAGFKISSLLKLQDTRANKPRVTLMHYLVEVAEEKDEKILTFPDEIKHLSEASRLSVDFLKSEIGMLKKKIEGLESQLETADEGTKAQLETFLESANKDIEQLLKDMDEIDILSQKLALYFCEEPKQFKLEESLSVLKTFAERIKQCQDENKKRKVQEAKAEARRIKKEEQEKAIAASGGKLKKVKAPPPQEEGCIIDNLLSDIRKGFPLRKTQVHSPSSDGGTRLPNSSKVNRRQKGELEGQSKKEEVNAGGKGNGKLDGIETNVNEGKDEDQTNETVLNIKEEKSGNGDDKKVNGTSSPEKKQSEEITETGTNEVQKKELKQGDVNLDEENVIGQDAVEVQSNSDKKDGEGILADSPVKLHEEVKDDGDNSIEVRVTDIDIEMPKSKEDNLVNGEVNGHVSQERKEEVETDPEAELASRKNERNASEENIWQVRVETTEEKEAKAPAVVNGGIVDVNASEADVGVSPIVEESQSSDKDTISKSTESNPVISKDNNAGEADALLGLMDDHEDAGKSVSKKTSDEKPQVSSGRPLVERENSSWDNLSLDDGVGHDGNGQEITPIEDASPTEKLAPMAAEPSAPPKKKKKKFHTIRSFFSGIKKGLSAPKLEEGKVERSNSFSTKDAEANSDKLGNRPKRSQSLTFTNKSKVKSKEKLKNSQTFSEGPLSSTTNDPSRSPNSNNNNSRTKTRYDVSYTTSKPSSASDQRQVPREEFVLPTWVDHHDSGRTTIEERRRVFSMQRSISNLDDKFNEQEWRKLHARYSFVRSEDDTPDKGGIRELPDTSEEVEVQESLTKQRKEDVETDVGNDVGRFVVSRYIHDPNFRMRSPAPHPHMRRQSIGMSWPK